MISQKSHSLKLFLWKNIFIVGAGFLISFFSLNFNTNEASALFTPTLSASVDQANLQVNGNQVINSANKTTEIPLNLIVNTNNKTGYTATLNSETNETALVNNDSSTNEKINSISANLSLNNLPNNTWGYKFNTSSNYAPIPALSTPAQILQTTRKTNGNDTNGIKIGMKLSDNLESGRYTNKLIFSILTNNYNPIAIMTEGPDFNAKLKALETATDKIEHFKKSPVAPAISMNAVNIDDEESDYEIKLWLDPTDKTAYYYTEPEKVYLNTNSSKMFFPGFDEQKIKNILEIDISNFDTSKVTNMYAMFRDMSNLTTLNLSNFDTSKAMRMNYMFSGMRSLTTLDLSNFDTSQLEDMYAMFRGVSNLTTLNLSNFDTSRVTNMMEMFSGMSNLTSLNLSNFNTSNVKNMMKMFQDMSNLTTLNLSNFNTSKVMRMDSMFEGMSSLTNLNLSNFNTSNVTNMYSMFRGVSNLTTLNLSSFDTSKVMDMREMFYEMHSLTNLDLSNFDTSNVTDMHHMFYDVRSLTSLNLSNFDTSKVTDMDAMFCYMTNLTSLDLSNFNTSNVKNMNSMFYLQDKDKLKDKLETIYVNNDFNTAKLKYSLEMFGNRKKLRGGNGSYLANPLAAGKTWLRIDDPAHGRPGYFTRKP